MIYSKLVDILSVFSQEETARFRDFVLSPFFNKNEKIVRITEAICQKLSKNPPEEVPEKEVLFSEIFPDEPLSPQKINLLIQEALHLSESFITHINTKDTGYSDEEFIRMGFYSERGLMSHFHDSITKAENKSARLTYHNPRYYYEQFRLELNKRWYNMNNGNPTEGLSFIEGINTNLNRFFILSKLMVQCQQLGQEVLVHKSIDITWINQHLSALKMDDALKENYLASIYLKLLNLFVNEFESQSRFIYIAELLGDMDKYASFLSVKDRGIICECLENYCIHWIFEGDRLSEFTLFRVYERQKEMGTLFSYDHTISAQKFIRVFKTALNAEKTTWAREFFSQYNQYLNNTFRKPVTDFCQAELLYIDKKYKEAYILLGKTPYFNPVFSTEYRILAIKLLTALDYDLESELNKFRVFISRNHGINSNRKNYYRKFASCIHKIQTIKSETPEKAGEELRRLTEMIGSGKAVAEFGYLKSVIEEIRNSHKFSV